MPRNRPEAELQERVVQWARQKYAIFSVLFFAVNNNSSSPAAGAIAKRLGTLKGVSDIICAFGNSRSKGFSVEFKAKGNYATPEQKEFLQALKAQGWETLICYSFAQATEFIDDYMARP